jgi:signal peptidase I
MTRSPRNLVGILVSVALLAFGWWLLGPVQLGGPTGYAVVNGSSMEPHLERGDLVLVRTRDSYGVGDVVLYEDHESGARVLHRIVGVRGGRLVTKGDNNDFRDPVHPAPDDVLGELWISVPGAGGAVSWLKQPAHLAILLAILAFLGFSGGGEVARRRRVGGRPVVALPDPSRPDARSAAVPTGSTLALAGGVALLVFGALALVAWSANETAGRTVPALYTHEGAFSYHAAGEPDPVYPSGVVTTGAPVFTRLVDDLELGFRYRLSTGVSHRVRGTIALDAVVSDTSGWTRTLPVAPSRRFSGAAATAAGTLDVQAFEELVESARTLTEAPLASITVNVQPVVHVTGSVGETPVDESFAPVLTLSYDGTTLRPVPARDAEPDAAPPYDPRREVSGRETVTTPLGLGPLSLGVADARRIALLGVLVSLVVVGLGGLLAARTRNDGSVERIARRYGTRIVAARATVPAERWVTELDDMDALVRIADAYERVILHLVEDGEDVYLVDDGVAVYRYRVARTALAVGAEPRAAFW